MKRLFAQNQNLVSTPKESHLRIYNDLDCKVTVFDSLFGNFTIEPLDVFHKDYTIADDETSDLLFIRAESACQLKASNLTQQVSVVNGMVRILKLLLESMDKDLFLSMFALT